MVVAILCIYNPITIQMANKKKHQQTIAEEMSRARSTQQTIRVNKWKK